MIIVRTPLRICFGGGGTDLHHWFKDFDSYIITAAINKYIYISLSERNFENKKFWISYSDLEVLNNKKNIKHTIIREVLTKFDYNKSLEVHTISEVPGNSGLGSSGSLCSGLILGISKLNKKKISKPLLAKQSVDIEKKINKNIYGIQDQYISTYGGIISINIRKAGKHIKVKKFNMPKNNLQTLERNIKIIYSNKQRNSFNILKKMSSKIRINKSSASMKKIQDLAYETKKIFCSNNIDDYGKLLNQHWRYKKDLGVFMSDKKIDSLYDNLLLNGCTGGKIIGAGGGGFFMCYVPIFKNFLLKNSLAVLDWKFDLQGAKIIYNN